MTRAFLVVATLVTIAPTLRAQVDRAPSLDVTVGIARPLGSARIMAGPGMYWVDARGGFEETRNFGGLSARVDLATRPFWRAGFVLSGRVAWIPGFTPGRGTHALGVGIRVQ